MEINNKKLSLTLFTALSLLGLCWSSCGLFFSANQKSTPDVAFGLLMYVTAILVFNGYRKTPGVVKGWFETKNKVALAGWVLLCVLPVVASLGLKYTLSPSANHEKFAIFFVIGHILYASVFWVCLFGDAFLGKFRAWYKY